MKTTAAHRRTTAPKRLSPGVSAAALTMAGAGRGSEEKSTPGVGPSEDRSTALATKPTEMALTVENLQVATVEMMNHPAGWRHTGLHRPRGGHEAINGCPCRHGGGRVISPRPTSTNPRIVVPGTTRPDRERSP